MSGVTLVTGGAGFIGTNLADRLLRDGERVRVVDDLSRPGVEENLRWLEARHDRRLEVTVADLRDPAVATAAMAGTAGVFHLAAQVAVTTSLDEPVHDFEVNLGATINVLEAARKRRRPPALLFTSTNKVYGDLADVALRDTGTRYEPLDEEIRRAGVSEARPLDFSTPYGCSKGAADQYVLDYAKSYGLPTVVFRMSCIYGPHQQGTEDQGWIAHFARSAMDGEPITLYGDGRQVRDVLYVEDLVEAMLAARHGIDALAGQPFNMGGGPAQTVSLREVIDQIAALGAAEPEFDHGPWRTGDQRYYVSDTSRFRAATGWRPRVDPRTGIERLHAWLHAGLDAGASARPEPKGAARPEPKGAARPGPKGAARPQPSTV
jgi:CDP-paratose 2-epimerase